MMHTVELIALDDAEIKYSTVQTGIQVKNGVGESSTLTKRGFRKTLKFLGSLKQDQQLHGSIHHVF